MAGRVRREPQAAEFQRLAILHLEHAVPRSHAVPIQPRSAGRSQRQLMTSNMIAVRMRDKAPGLTTTDIDRQLCGRQKQSSVVMEQFNSS
jgi:hypothetical protein